MRRELPGDAAAIGELLKASFPTAAEANLVSALRAANHLPVSMVAVEAEQIVGHIAFSPVLAESGQMGLGLAPIAVASTHRGRGIARLLIEKGIADCQQLSFEWIVVLGDPAMYARFGFLPASDFSIRDEYGGGPAFQVLELTVEALNEVSGTARYGSEFQAFAS